MRLQCFGSQHFQLSSVGRCCSKITQSPTPSPTTSYKCKNGLPSHPSSPSPSAKNLLGRLPLDPIMKWSIVLICCAAWIRVARCDQVRVKPYPHFVLRQSKHQISGVENPFANLLQSNMAFAELWRYLRDHTASFRGAFADRCPKFPSNHVPGHFPDHVGTSKIEVSLNHPF